MVLPGFLHLSLVQAIVKPGIMIGAQNCSAFGEGAYTGEVAADHIKDYQVNHVMIGHSERRRLYGETQEMVAQKVLNAEDCDLGILYCLGETKEARDSERNEEVLMEQLEALKAANISNWGNVVLVYEPLWALNTGTIASADQTQEAAEFIRGWIRTNIGEEQAEVVRVVYGGSVTETNADKLIELPDVDGFMIGSTSTKPIFRTIFDIANQYVEAIL
eukprot:Macronucleus_3000.p1 GENE.Macronucleus_3000~~Macronucleus_3000.p1  ORF type:complete len:218 (+),score=73.69 Macronucleus_3000:1-654(+)